MIPTHRSTTGDFEANIEIQCDVCAVNYWVCRNHHETPWDKQRGQTKIPARLMQTDGRLVGWLPISKEPTHVG